MMTKMERKKEEVLEELSYLKDRLEKLEQLFNLSENEEETEALIYEEKAVMLRYSKVIREAKELGITAAGKEKVWQKY